MKIFEFINNENYIDIIDEFIFWDGDEWMFPDSEGGDIHIGAIVGKGNLPEFKKISKIIVDKLNEREVGVDNYELEFNKIIKEITKEL
jgi:hypothetical protein